MRRAYVWAAALLVVVVGAGLALGQERGSGSGSGGAGAASGAATQMPAPVANGGGNVTVDGQPASVAAGATLYAANCQTCHGVKGQGGKVRGIGSEAARPRRSARVR